MSLFKRTAAFGLYDLSPSSLVFCELSAMQAGLALLEQSLEQVEDALSLSSMRRDQLEALCTLHGASAPAGLETKQLREYCAVLRSGCADSSLQEIQKYLHALGAQVQLVEQPEQRRVLLTGKLGNGLYRMPQALQQALQDLLPAQLDSALATGELTWEGIELANLNMQALDEIDLTWEQWDTFSGPLPERK